MTSAAKMAHGRLMYLLPFAGKGWLEQRIAENIRKLFQLLAEILNLLIINMPLRDFGRRQRTKVLYRYLTAPSNTSSP